MKQIFSPTKPTNLEKPLSGFTLVEIIVVLAIIGIVFGMSFPFFARFAKGIKLKSAATNISTVLRTARSYAITQRKNYMVVIDNEIDITPYYAVKIYQADEGTIDRWYKLPQGIIIKSTTFGTEEVPFPSDSDGGTTMPVVEFKPTGGIAGSSASIHIQETANTNNERWITVINTTGRIKITDEEP